MSRLSDAYQSTSLRTKLSLLVSAALLATLIASQFALYLYVADAIERQSRNAADITMTQIQTYMESQLRSIVERLFYIRLDPSFDEALTDYLLDENPASVSGVAMTRLSPCLSLHKVTEPLINSLFLYTPAGSFTDMGLAVEQGYEFEDSVLWRQLEESDAYVTWGNRQTDEIFITHRQIIPVMYRFTVDGYGGNCVLLANIDCAKLTQYLLKVLPDSTASLLIVDEDGVLISDPSGPAALLAQDPQQLKAVITAEEGFVSLQYEGENYLIAQRSLASAPWHVIYLQSNAAIFGLLSKVRLVFLLVSLAALLVLLMQVERIVYTVTTPLSRLSAWMQKAEQENTLLPFEYPYNNEVGALAKSYNHLSAHIEALLEKQECYIQQLQDEKDRVQLEQQLKRRAELKALQSQINPHFLYNTLDSIRWKAEMANAHDISQMTTALATLFRIGLSRGREIISLEQEIRHVDSYLQIQKLRYGKQLDYAIEIDPKLLSLYTVKLILQPLVENSIYHGIKESDEPGRVTITAQRTGDVLELKVCDSGPGIPPERLSMLQADLKRGLSVSDEGYGIFNVNERIRLYFGAEYGLTLESLYGHGTAATVRLPCITEQEVERYVSLTDC